MNAGMDDASLYKSVLTDRTAELEFESAVRDTFPGAFRIDHLAAGMNGNWMAASKIAPCEDRERDCFTCSLVSYSDEFSGTVCRKCYNSKYLHAGVCVDNCPDGYVGDGTGQFDRRCVEEHTTKGSNGGRARKQVLDPDRSPLWQTYSVSGVVATLVFNSTATALEFEEIMLGCSKSLCVAFTSSSWPCPSDKDQQLRESGEIDECPKPKVVSLCPHLKSQPACDFTTQASFFQSAAGMGSMAGLVILAIVGSLFVVRAKKSTSTNGDSGKRDNVTSFDNPMYNDVPAGHGESADDNEGLYSDVGGSDQGESLYDDVDDCEGFGNADEAPDSLYAGFAPDDDDATGFDGFNEDSGAAGYMDVQGVDDGAGGSGGESGYMVMEMPAKPKASAVAIDPDVARAKKLLKKKHGRDPTAAEIEKKVSALKKKRAAKAAAGQ